MVSGMPISSPEARTNRSTVPRSTHGSAVRPEHLVLAASIGLVCAVYWVALGGPFLLDDQSNLPPTRISSLDFASLREVATGNTSGVLGRPLPVLTFALNFYFGEDRGAFDFKLVNLLIHALNTLLVYVLCTYLIAFLRRRPTALGPDRLAAALAAAVWTLHPIQVGTVMYVVQRMTLMMSLFTLAALCAYCIARRRQILGEGRAVPWLVLSASLALFACLSKENGVLIPAYALCIELIAVGRVVTSARSDVLWHRLMACACAMGIAVVVIALLTRLPQLADDYAGREFGPGQRLLAELNAMVLYLRMMLAPDLSVLTFYHDHFHAPARLGAREIVSALILGGLCVVAVLERRKRPVLTLGIALLFCAHSLESTLLPLELVFEHRNYLALLGLALPLAMGLAALAGDDRRRRFGLGLSLCLIPILSVITQQRAVIWSDGLILHYEAVRHAPRSERAWVALAVTLAERGDLHGALATLERAAETLEPGPGLPLQRLQITWFYDLHDERHLDAAIRAFRRGSLAADDAVLLSELVEQRALSTHTYPRPEHLLALYDAAADAPDRRLSDRSEAMLLAQHQWLLTEAGEVGRALPLIARAAALNPDNGEIALRHAETLVLAGRANDAAAAYARAAHRAPPGNRDVASRLERIERAIALADANVGGRE